LALSGTGSVATSSQVNVANAAGTFDISSTSAGATIMTLNGVANSQVTLGNQTLTIANGSTTYAGIIGGTGGLTLTTGTQILTGTNTYTGVTTINGGTLQIGNGGTIGSIVSDVVNNGALAFNRSDAVTFAGDISGTGSIILAGSGTVTFTGTNTSTGGTTIGAGTLTAGGPNVFSATGAMTVAAAATLDVNGFDQAIGSIAGAGTVTNNGAAAATLTTGAANTSTTFSGVIKDGGAALALTKVGTGTLTLSGVNSFTGDTTISAGTLALSGTGGIASSSQVNVANAAGTFDISATTSGAIVTTLNGVANSHVALGSRTLTISNGSSTYAGLIGGTGGLTLAAGTQTLSGTNTYTGVTSIDGGTLALSGSGSIASSSQVNVTTAVGTFDISATTAGATITTLNGVLNSHVTLGNRTLTISNGSTTYAGLIGGTGGLTLTAGTQTLSGANTYTGDTIINGGTLKAGANNTFSSASAFTVAAGALLDLNGFDQGTGSLAGAGTVGNTGAAAATLTTGGDNTSTTFSGAIIDDAPTGLTKIGNGTLTLTGANTYSGATSVDAGTLQGGAVNTFSGASAFTVAGGAFLDLNGLNQVIGSLAGAGTVTNAGGATATLTTGADNTSTAFSGIIQNGASAIALTKSGTGTLTLSGVNTYTGITTVNAGTLSVTGDISTSSGVTVNTGGTLNGTGSVSGVTVNNGGTLAPGLPPAIGALSIKGSLLLASAATYMVTVSPGGASSISNITGSASLGGTLAVTALPGSYSFGTKYTLLTTTGAGLVTGTFTGLTVAGSFGSNVKPVLSYDDHDAFLTLTPGSSLPPLPPGASGNQGNTANAINAFIASGGTLPSGFVNLANLPPDQLAAALTQLSGEANAGGGQTAGFQITNQFMLAMLNPFGSDRSGGIGAAGFGPAGTGAVSQYAPTRNLPPKVANAYAAVTPRSEGSLPFSTRWNVWALAFGGANNTSGDPNGSGSHNTASRTAGVAAGLDYKLTPDTLLGFALAGGGTGWSVAQGLGGGQSDVFQAGLYGSQQFGRWYVSGAGSFANYWMSTSRTVTIPGTETLNAGFIARSWGARAETGYKLAWASVNVTPYTALQVQTFATPFYSEHSTSGSGQFALSYAAHRATVTRGELGSWASKDVLLADNAVMTAFGRAAYAHDWQPATQANATFLGLSPIANFSVGGAKPAADLAVFTTGAEIQMMSGWALMGKFDGEFGVGTQTYVGTGRARYAW
jgi:autotransporter-associated beta strand protein